MTESLFPDIPPAEPVEPMSADRRRTLRQRAQIDAGRHPLAHTALTTIEGAFCGNCAHREIVGHHSTRPVGLGAARDVGVS